MKHALRFICIMLCSLYLASLSGRASVQMVRVLLKESCASVPVSIETDAGCFLLDGPQQSKRKIKCSVKRVQIGVHKAGLVINGKQWAHDALYLIPISGRLCFEGDVYDGIFLITKHENKLLVINIVDLERYVTSVLRTESWPSWSVEVNKVLAIACRSYVLAMMYDNELNHKPYHIKNTNHHQTYRGAHDQQHLKEAVLQTKGLFLSHDDRPIIAMFDCCCGGVIPALIEGINHEQAPYLARNYACTFCRVCKIYTWNATFSVDVFFTQLKKSVPDLTRIGRFVSCSVTRTDKAGLVLAVTVKGTKGSQVISGQKMYSAFKEIKSFYFSVSKKGNVVSIKGKGYGHHRGLCQWAVPEMIRHGWDCLSILTFFYPGTTFAKLK